MSLTYSKSPAEAEVGVETLNHGDQFIHVDVDLSAVVPGVS